MGSREMLSSVFHFPAGITIDSIDPSANELVIRIACDFPHMCIGYLAHPFSKGRTPTARSLFFLGTELSGGTRGTGSSGRMARGRRHHARTTDPC